MRLLPALALSAALGLGACTYPDGSLNVPGTLALGAGAAVAGLAIASANDRPRYSNNHYYHRQPSYRQPSYAYGPRYGHGYGYGPRYRGW